MYVSKCFWQFFDLTDLRPPPAELKVASDLSEQNTVGTLYAINELSPFKTANFYENINAYY